MMLFSVNWPLLQRTPHRQISLSFCVNWPLPQHTYTARHHFQSVWMDPYHNIFTHADIAFLLCELTLTTTYLHRQISLSFCVNWPLPQHTYTDRYHFHSVWIDPYRNIPTQADITFILCELTMTTTYLHRQTSLSICVNGPLPQHTYTDRYHFHSVWIDPYCNIPTQADIAFLLCELTMTTKYLHRQTSLSICVNGPLPQHTYTDRYHFHSVWIDPFHNIPTQANITFNLCELTLTTTYLHRQTSLSICVNWPLPQHTYTGRHHFQSVWMDLYHNIPTQTDISFLLCELTMTIRDLHRQTSLPFCVNWPLSQHTYTGRHHFILCELTLTTTYPHRQTSLSFCVNWPLPQHTYTGKHLFHSVWIDPYHNIPTQADIAFILCELTLTTTYLHRQTSLWFCVNWPLP